MLDKLPAELVDKVASNVVDLADLRALRLTCWSLYDKTTNQYALSTVKTQQLDLSAGGLARLEEVAKNDKFRFAVRALHFRRETLVPFGHGVDWPRDMGAAAGLNIGEVPKLRELWGLFKLPACLPACREFHFRDRHSTDIAGNPLHRDLTDLEALALLLAVITQPGVNPQALTLHFAFNSLFTRGQQLIDPEFCTSDNFSSAWKQLRTLSIGIKLNATHALNLVNNIILNSQNLKALTLDLKAIPWVVDVAAGARAQDLFETLAHAKTLPAIENLQILGVPAVRATTLIKVLCRQEESLKSLVLREVHLAGSLDSLDSKGQEGGTWDTVLACLAEGNFIKLEHFDATFLSQRTGDPPAAPPTPTDKFMVAYHPARFFPEGSKPILDEVYATRLLPGLNLNVQRIPAAEIVDREGPDFMVSGVFSRVGSAKMRVVLEAMAASVRPGKYNQKR